MCIRGTQKERRQTNRSHQILLLLGFAWHDTASKLTRRFASSTRGETATDDGIGTGKNMGDHRKLPFLKGVGRRPRPVRHGIVTLKS